jgi:hypothetical protein
MINEVLRLSTEEEGEPLLWLADTYDTIPDYNPTSPGAQGTLSPIDSNWRSPFIGSSVEEVAAFISATPKPPKPLNKLFFAVLQKERFEQSKQILIYKIREVGKADDRKLMLHSATCPAHLAGHFLCKYDRYHYFWNQAVEHQGLYYGHGYPWDDDDIMKDLWTLVVVDDFPIEVCVLFLPHNENHESQKANNIHRPSTKS